MFNFFSPVRCVSNLLPLSSGLTIPQLGFGTSNISTSKAAEIVEYAIRCGFRHIDCAKKYSNQSEIGRAIQETIKSKLVQREHLFITANIWCSEKNLYLIKEECCNSLHELRLDYLDMCVLHWPRRACHEYVCKSVAEVNDVKKTYNDVEVADDYELLLSYWKEMNKLVESNLVRSIGVATCNEQHLKKIICDNSTRSPVINQIEWHPAHVDYSLQSVHQQNEILTCALCPLGISSGSLTNNSSNALLQDQTIKIMAERFGFTPARLLLNWNANNGNVIIISSSNKDHIKDNAKAERYAVHDAARIVLDSYHRFVQSYEVLSAK